VTYHCWFNHQPTTTIVLVSLTIHGLKRQWYVTAGFWLELVVIGTFTAGSWGPPIIFGFFKLRTDSECLLLPSDRSVVKVSSIVMNLEGLWWIILIYRV
jgi:hypothetical protein